MSFPYHILQVLTLEQSIKECKLHACMHHIAIIVIIVNVDFVSHATLILYYHVSMLTL